MHQDSSFLVQLGLDKLDGWNKVSEDVIIRRVVDFDLMANESLWATHPGVP